MMCDTIFLCLPTPMRWDGDCDLNILHSSLFEINTLTEFEGKGSKTIIIKSTIPPGTTEQLNKQYNHLNILFNPEFLTERNEEDYNNQNRIIIGVQDHNQLK